MKASANFSASNICKSSSFSPNPNAIIGSLYFFAKAKRIPPFAVPSNLRLYPPTLKRPVSFKVLEAEFVNTEEGTGIVHMAPGFGEDDQTVCEANGIKLVCPVDDQGKFTKEVPDYEGLQVFEANEKIIQELKQKKSLM